MQVFHLIADTDSINVQVSPGLNDPQGLVPYETQWPSVKHLSLRRCLWNCRLNNGGILKWKLLVLVAHVWVFFIKRQCSNDTMIPKGSWIEAEMTEAPEAMTQNLLALAPASSVQSPFMIAAYSFWCSTSFRNTWYFLS